MIATAVFDWDGTLHDTIGIYSSAIRKTLEHLTSLSLPVPKSVSDDELKKYLGVNPPDMWRSFAPELDESFIGPAVSYAGEKLIDGINSGAAVLYPGALEAVKQVRSMGINTVFLSNCTSDYMRCFTRLFALDGLFDAMYCCEDYGYIPKEEIFPNIMSSFPGQYVVIGDRYSDMKCAVAHGTYSIGCLYGFGSYDELACASVTASSPEEIPGLIAGLA
jgi:phosphoglycolate phosphatase